MKENILVLRNLQNKFNSIKSFIDVIPSKNEVELFKKMLKDLKNLFKKYIH